MAITKIGENTMTKTKTREDQDEENDHEQDEYKITTPRTTEQSLFWSLP